MVAMPEPIPEEKVSTKVPHYAVTVIAWILVLAILVSFYFWYSIYFPATNSKTAVSNNPGYILMSLSVAAGPQRPYDFDVAKSSFDRSPYNGLSPSASVDGKYVVWSAGIPHGTAANIAGVFLYNANLATSTLFASGGTGVPETPQLSPHDTAVVFAEPTATSSTSNAFFTPSTWNIYFARTGTAPRVIVHGMYPHWSPSGRSILYLSDNGLHLYNIASSTDYLVWPMAGGSASTRMMLTVSKDGTKLAWTNPLHEQILIANITSWSPFKATEVMRIPVFAFWPVFSPDDNQLAFEQVNWSTTPSAQPTDPRLTVFNFSSKTIRTLVNLSPFNQMGIFVSDWTTTI